MTDGKVTAENRRLELIGLAAVLVLSLVFRLRHMESLLPWWLFVDEVRTTDVTLHLLTQRTLDPAHHFYPALAFYVNAVFYYLWAAAGQIGVVLSKGPGAIFDWFYTLDPKAPATIMLSRWISLGFGLATIVVSHLLARLYLSWRWALFATLLVAINTSHIHMSVLAKVDTIQLFWFLLSFWTSLVYYRNDKTTWLVVGAVTAGFTFVTKNNFVPMTFISLLIVAKNLEPVSRYRDILRQRNLWLGLGLIAVGAFIGSPYTFIRLGDTLQTAGWLYKQAEIISFYHTDPHVWWLDRYYYALSIVFPFVFGLPLFWASVAGLAYMSKKSSLKEPFLWYFGIGFAYMFTAGSGGPLGGSYPYYLFIIIVPPGIIALCGMLSDMTASASKWAPTVAKTAALFLIAWSLFRVDAAYDMFLSGHDRLGIWIERNIEADDKVLLVSVHDPGVAFNDKQIKLLWPHHLKREAIEEYDPDYLIFDTWALGGFRKLYREMEVWPLASSYIKGEKGYNEVERFEPHYFNKSYYAALDPEHDVEFVVLKRRTAKNDYR